MTLAGSTVLFLVLVAGVIGDQFEVYFQWNFINYTWPSSEVYEEAVRDSAYIRENNLISAIKVWKDQVYLTIPRQKRGIPATLAAVSKNAETSPLLEPYPNWEMQRIGDCFALQSAQGIEIDPRGTMWVVNSGRIEVSAGHPALLCPSRLMIFDIENNGEILLDYIFPERAVHFNSAYLGNLILDHESGGFAYVADFNEDQPGIIVFSLKEKRSWKLFHESMRTNFKASPFIFNEAPSINTHLGGIALSPSSDEKGDRLVYYSPATSYEMFLLSTVILKNNDTANLDFEIRNILGNKLSFSGGMLMSSTGILYMGYLSDDAIGVWDVNRQRSFSYGQKIWVHNVEWPGAFAIDEFEFLWCTTNRPTVTKDGTIDISKVNSRIMRSFVNSKNYQYYKNGGTPVLPGIAESSIFRILFMNFRVSLSHVRKRAFSLS